MALRAPQAVHERALDGRDAEDDAQDGGADLQGASRGVGTCGDVAPADAHRLYRCPSVVAL